MSASTDKTLCLCFKEHMDDIGGQDGDTGGVCIVRATGKGQGIWSWHPRPGPHIPSAAPCSSLSAPGPRDSGLPPASGAAPLTTVSPVPFPLPLTAPTHFTLPPPGDPSPSDSMTSTLG